MKAKVTRAELERVANAARWYVACVVDGARQDCAWFELENAVAALGDEDEADLTWQAGARARLST